MYWLFSCKHDLNIVKKSLLRSNEGVAHVEYTSNWNSQSMTLRALVSPSPRTDTQSAVGIQFEGVSACLYVCLLTSARHDTNLTYNWNLKLKQLDCARVWGHRENNTCGNELNWKTTKYCI